MTTTRRDQVLIGEGCPSVIEPASINSMDETGELRKAVARFRAGRPCGIAMAAFAALALGGCASAASKPHLSPSAAVGSSGASSESSAGAPVIGIDATTEQRLWKSAVSAASAQTGTVLLAEAVKSTHATAVRVTSGDGVSGEEPVWVIQVTGAAEFVCRTCSEPMGGQAPKGRYLTLVLDATTFDQTDFGLEDKAANLAQLGAVISLHG